MTTAHLEFDIAEWIASDFGDDLDRTTTAAIRIVLGSEVITRLEDRAAKTVRETARVSAYRLAYWLAENWWRLRWEPESGTGSADHDWAMSHRITAAGGYIWPNIAFASDGLVVRVSTKPIRLPPELSPVEYLASADAFVSAPEFEDAVDRFVNQVIQRVRELGLLATRLPELWAEVRRERDDADLGRLRRLEARLGLDPDEGSPGLVEQVLAYAETFGTEAVEEIAVAARSEGSLAALRALEAQRAAPAATIEVPAVADLRQALEGLQGEALLPWQLGERLADRARELWGLGAGPLDDGQLAGIGGASAQLLDAEAEVGLPDNMDAAAYKNLEKGQQMKIAIRGSRPESRRFRFARLLVEPVVADGDERLFPATRSTTCRQRIQRAFATQLLCPYPELRGMLPEAPTDEDIDAAARQFGVSPLLVGSMLVNKGDLDRDRFFGG